MFWNRFDICEAYYVLAHDFGLYALFDRIERMGFSAGMRTLTYDTLEENGKAIYDALTERAYATDKFATRLAAHV